MVKDPKRRKCKENPYRLNFEKEIVSFIDSKGILQEVKVSSEVFELFDSFELEDISYLHKVDKYADFRNYDNSELMDAIIYHNTQDTNKSIIDIIQEQEEIDLLYKLINDLPEIQKRRIKKYFFDNKTFNEIAIEESCTKRAVKFSIDIALKNILEKIKK
ncbi:MAG: hypothetical protein Q4G05_01740 [Clostridia bacterium]|nr:hypothetical protein [Clostridia bacterium]